MRIFLDTSLLSDIRLPRFSNEIVSHYLAGDRFYESVISHFQIMWGYSVAGRPPDRYQTFLRKTGVEIVPLTKTDAEAAASSKPAKADLLDALIASSVRRYDAVIWTADRDFLRYLPKENVLLLGA